MCSAPSHSYCHHNDTQPVHIRQPHAQYLPPHKLCPTCPVPPPTQAVPSTCWLPPHPHGRSTFALMAAAHSPSWPCMPPAYLVEEFQPPPFLLADGASHGSAYLHAWPQYLMLVPPCHLGVAMWYCTYLTSSSWAPAAHRMSRPACRGGQQYIYIISAMVCLCIYMHAGVRPRPYVYIHPGWAPGHIYVYIYIYMGLHMFVLRQHQHSCTQWNNQQVH